MNRFMLLLSVLLLVSLPVQANHFLGASESGDFGGHAADCGEAMKGPYRGLGKGFDKRPVSAIG